MSTDDKEKEVTGSYNSLQERREIIQDVIDRLLSNPEYKAKLLKLNQECPSLIDYNRNFSNDR